MTAPVPPTVEAAAAWAARMAARRAHASSRPSSGARRYGIALRRFAGPATYRSQLGHLRIAHLTDLHVGRITPFEVQRTAVEMTNAERPTWCCSPATSSATASSTWISWPR